MTIVLWNCCNGISRKEQIDYLMSFKPDIAILPELKKHNIECLNPCDHLWVTNNHNSNKPKGLGVLAFNGFKIIPLPRDEEMEIFLPIRVRGADVSFNLLAIWNFHYRCKQGRFKNVDGEGRLEYSALRFYKHLFDDHCLVAGDWNIGPTLRSTKSYQLINEILAESSIKNLYSLYKRIDPMNIDYVTHVHSRGKNHIIDHIFGSEYFQKNLDSLEIPKMSNVILSDHAPLVLKLN